MPIYSGDAVPTKADPPPPLDYRPPERPRPLLDRLATRPVLWAVAGGICLFLFFVLTQQRPYEGSPPRLRCQSHEHQIGLAILLYAQDHSGHYPPALADLLADEQIGPEVFTCPASNATAAVLPATPPTTQQVAAALAVPGHLSYVYCGHADWVEGEVPADAVILYEPPANHANDGANVLFGDGHVDWVPMPRAARLIAAAAATTRPVSAATVP